MVMGVAGKVVIDGGIYCANDLPSCASTHYAQAPRRLLKVITCHISPLSIHLLLLRRHQGGCFGPSYPTLRVLAQGG